MIKLIFSVILYIVLFIYCSCGLVSDSRNPNLDKQIYCGIPHDPSSLDPASTNDLIYDKIVFNIFETLVRYDWSTQKYIPCLAVSWEKSENDLNWTFHLRTNVLFHDNSSLNAEVVKTSFLRQIDSDCPFFQLNQTDIYGKIAFEMIDKIFVVNDSTLQFQLKYPCNYFLDNICSPYFSSIVSSTALTKNKNQFFFEPIGTGPFKFVRWEKGNLVLLEKFDKYWNKAPEIEKITYKIIPMLSDRINLLKTGKLDIITGLSASSTNELYHQPDIKIYTPQITGTTFLGFNCKSKSFNKVDVRKAVLMALDIKSMIAYCSRGFASIAQGPLPPEILSYDSTLKQAEYNIIEAKNFMTRAGYADGFQATLSFFIQTDSLRASPISQYLEKQLQKIHIQIKIKPYNNWHKYNKEILEQGHTDMFLDGWAVYTKNADNFLYSLFHSQSKINFFNYSNPEVDQLLEKARLTQSTDLLQKLYHEIQHIIENDTPAIFLSHPKIGYALNKRIINFETNPATVIRFNTVEIKQK